MIECMRNHRLVGQSENDDEPVYTMEKMQMRDGGIVTFSKGCGLIMRSSITGEKYLVSKALWCDGGWIVECDKYGRDCKSKITE